MKRELGMYESNIRQVPLPPSLVSRNGMKSIPESPPPTNVKKRGGKDNPFPP
jgi:hypothetical protein